MRVIRILILFITLITTTSMAQAAFSTLTTWQGVYVYHGYGGHTEGGSPITLDMTLTISPTGDCKLEREGFQRNDEIICSTVWKDNAVDIVFKSYPGGKIENEYGIAVYKPGERLFSLYPKGKRDGLITVWGRLKPGFEKKHGHFFQRAKKK